MIIHRYSRKDAIRDGVYITGTAKDLFKVPIAVTRTVWDGYIKNSDRRVWDTLWMLYLAIKKNPQNDTVIYKLYYEKELVKLKAMIGPGDTEEPVKTIMLPEED